MHAVVNKLTLSRPFDNELLEKIDSGFYPLLRSVQGFLDMRVVGVSDAEAIILVFFQTREALDKGSALAAPWFAENIRPYLGGPVQRSVGEIISQSSH
jgi:hypothetical protein